VKFKLQNVPERSELRGGYSWLQSWIDGGMKPKARVAFTEGDLRLAGQLIEYAIAKERASGQHREGCKCHSCRLQRWKYARDN